MHKMTIELKNNNKDLKEKVRNLAFSCGITRVDGNEYFGDGTSSDFENFAIFMIKLMDDKEFLNNCKTWLWDEFDDEGDEAHYVDNVLEEVLKRMSEEQE